MSTATDAPGSSPLVTDLLVDRAASDPDAVALIGEAGPPLRFGEWLRLANACGRALAQRGVGAGDRVALWFAGTHWRDYATAYFGVLRAGAVAIPLSPRLTSAEVATAARHADCRVVLYGGAPASGHWPEQLPLLELAMLVAGSDQAEFQVPRVAADLVEILHSSGTTGTPKLVAASHANVLAGWRPGGSAPHRPGSYFVHATPMATNSGQITLLHSLREPHTCVVLAEFDADRYCQLIERYQAEHTLLVPAMAGWLVDSGAPARHKLSSVATVVLTSAPATPALLRRVADAFPAATVRNCYTTTEAWPAMTAMAYDPDRPDSLGRVLAGGELRILDTGEVALRAPRVPARYYLDQPAEQDTFVDGWVRTGDLGYLDPAGYLYLRGRRGDIVNVGGFNVAPAEVEAALAEHPAVAEVAAGAAPHTGLGEVLAAAVVTRTPIAASSLLAWLRGRLAEPKCPAWITLVPELPRNALGKVIRPRLRQLLTEAASGGDDTPARTEREAALARWWSELVPASTVRGVHDDLIRHGGHSLAIAALVARIRSRYKVEVSLAQVYADPTIAGIADAIGDCQLPDPPDGSGRLESGGLPGADHPLSPYQRRFWFLAQLVDGERAYPVLSVRVLAGHLAPEPLRRAVAQLIARHAPLRTSFHRLADEPVQRVADVVEPDLAIVDLRDAADPPGQARAALEAELARPFELNRAPLLRMRAIRLADDAYLLAMHLPHIAVDDGSVDLLWRDLGHYYRALVGEPEAELPPLPTSYPEYARWLAEPAQQHRRTEQLAYWRKQLAGAPARLELPTDRPRPPSQTFTGATHRFTVPAAVTTALAGLAARTGLTTFQVLLAAFQLLLIRYSGQPEVVVGVPVSRRLTEEVQATAGVFVNTVAVRVSRRTDPTVAEFLRTVRDRCQAALSHGDVPFEQVIEALNPVRDASYPPLCQVMFVLVDPVTPVALGPALTDLSAAPPPWAAGITGPPAAARFDLTLWLRPAGDQLAGGIDYHADLFDPATIARFAGALITVAAGMAREPQTRVSRVPLTADHELVNRLAGRVDQLAHDRRAGRGELAGRDAEFVTELISAAARARPDAPALLSEAGTTSYGDLERQANLLAHRLRRLGLEPGQLVGLAAPAGPAALIGLLGTLRAGGAYLPLDISQPLPRQHAILADAGVSTLLTADPATGRYAEFPGRVLAIDELALDALEPGRAGTATDPPLVPRHPRQPAYVIYTSGSTGAPKGVVVPHSALTNLARAFQQLHDFGPTDRVLMIPPLSFDASVGDIFPALISGAALVLHPNPAELGGQELLRLCADRRITAVDGPAALWQQWTDDLTPGPVEPPPELRQILVGGDRIATTHLRRFAELTGGSIELVNHYGPTEATVCATSYTSVDGTELAAGQEWLPIGRPLRNLRCYVLDPWGQPVPVGVIGELYLGGAGVAQGYHGRPAATAARFVPDPFGDEPGARLYRTGDRARWVGDQLEFLGRDDHQVKIRGHRVEPAEIEAALVAHPAVGEAVVTAGPDERLTGYVTDPGGELTPPALTAYLRDRLPDYLVPDRFLILPSMPLTPRGKIDRAALPAPPTTVARPAYRPPATATEQLVAQIFAQVLAVDAPIGRDDDFFELGGHSLLTLALSTRLRQARRREVPVRQVFQAPTVAGLAALLDAPATAPATAGSFDLDSEARLPAEICAELAPYRQVGPPRAALLTGATGFLGAFLLAQLLRDTTATVWCLVRADTEAAGRARILANLRRYELALPASQTERIRPLPGDLSAPQLGLAGDTFARLAEQLDLIYHNGGAVDFIRPYPELAPANVAGTREVLRLAGEHRPTPVHFVSTLGVFLTDRYRSALVTEADPPADPTGLHTGYYQSKWVADRLVAAAGHRGLPVTIHRPARVTGDQHSGAGPVDDYFSRLLKTFVQTAAVPEGLGETDLTPVDWLRDAIGHIAAQPTAWGGQFHYFNHARLRYDEIAAVLREAGYPVAREPYPQWRQRLLDRLDRGEEVALGALAAALPAHAGAGDEPRFDTRVSSRYVASRVGTCPPADHQLLHRYLDFFHRTGYLPAPPGG